MQNKNIFFRVLDQFISKDENNIITFYKRFDEINIKDNNFLEYSCLFKIVKKRFKENKKMKEYFFSVNIMNIYEYLCEKHNKCFDFRIYKKFDILYMEIPGFGIENYYKDSEENALTYTIIDLDF